MTHGTDLRVNPWVFLAYRLYWYIIVPVLLGQEVDWLSLQFAMVLAWQMLDMYLTVPQLSFFVYSQLFRMGCTIALTTMHLVNYYQWSEEERNPYIKGFGSTVTQRWVIAHYCLVLVFDVYSAIDFHWHSTMYTDPSTQHPHHQTTTKTQIRYNPL